MSKTPPNNRQDIAPKMKSMENHRRDARAPWPPSLSLGRWRHHTKMLHYARTILVAVVLGACTCFPANASYVRERWTVGKHPHRWGIVNDSDEYTAIYVGGPTEYSLHIHLYTFTVLLNVALIICVTALYYFWRRFRRHAIVA